MLRDAASIYSKFQNNLDSWVGKCLFFVSDTDLLSAVYEQTSSDLKKYWSQAVLIVWEVYKVSLVTTDLCVVSRP